MASAPWSVKGIDPKAREVAKDLARRSGMTLGEWLNRAILEGDTLKDVGSESEFPGRFERNPSRIRPVPEALVQPVEVGRLAERLRNLEAHMKAPRSTPPSDLLLAVEPMLQRMADRIGDAEARTSGALAEVKRAMSALDARIGAADHRHEAVAQSLTQRLEQVRAETAEALRRGGGGEVDARMAEMAEHVRAAERRSAKTLERMGREVLNMAEAVNRRLCDAEQRGADSIERVGGEIARIAGAVEARVTRAEQVQAEALEGLGVEIGRVTDRLDKRLLTSERRSAEAIDEVGEQVARVTKRIDHRHERASTDLAERVRQSEDRAAQLLAEARARLGPAPSTRSPVEPTGPFRPEEFSGAEPDLEVAPPTTRARGFARDEFESAGGFAPISEEEEDIFELDEIELPSADGTPPLSTGEVIEQARAAARAAQSAARPLPARAIERRLAQPGRLFSGFGVKTRRQTSPLHTALMVAGGAVFLSLAAAGVALMDRPGPGPGGYRTLAEVPRAAVALTPDQAATALTPAAANPANEADFRAAAKAIEAGEPGGLARLKALAEAGHAQSQFYLGQLYESGRTGAAIDLVEARRWTARAAEAGEPSAMHNLGLYFFRGEGAPQDLARAAQWFRKAASLGVAASQYNLGMMHQSGSGTPRDLDEARRWFTQAAAQGDAAAAAALKALDSAQAGTPKTLSAGATLSAAEAGRLLERLGYYDPAEGGGRAAFVMAVSNYQRDQGLLATGTLDGTTIKALSPFPL